MGDELPRLDGKKIAVFVEHKFIPEEIQAYRAMFAAVGAQVDVVSRIWYGAHKPGGEHWKGAEFLSDVDPRAPDPFAKPERLPLSDTADVSNLKLDEYAAVIMAANYVSVQLRWAEAPTKQSPREFVQSAPVVRFFAEAMRRPEIVKGFLCHGLWILTPNPDLLRTRRVTCNTVVMADVLNCDADVVFEQGEPKKVMQDGDVITGFSKAEVEPFIAAIVHECSKRGRRMNNGRRDR